jgi:hypothetical protein
MPLLSTSDMRGMRAPRHAAAEILQRQNSFIDISSFLSEFSLSAAPSA